MNEFRPHGRSWGSVSESYYTLVREMPLLPIAGEAHLDAALAVIDRLVRRPIDDGEQGYLDTLSELVIVYETAHRSRQTRTPADRLRAVLEQSGLTQVEFAHQTGISQSTVSAVLNGRRFFTAEQMRHLGKKFRVSPGYFLGTMP